jgi:hypothetical protein
MVYLINFVGHLQTFEVINRAFSWLETWMTVAIAGSALLGCHGHAGSGPVIPFAQRVEKLLKCT